MTSPALTVPPSADVAEPALSGPPPAPFGALQAGLDDWCAMTARELAARLAACLPDDDALLACLPDGAQQGSPDGYRRHLVHADPLGRFCAMLLVWRPGQWSPVHGHRTWCAYRVVRGALLERHYGWDGQAGVARHRGGATRGAGALVCVPPGLGHIHAFGNEGEDVAISLHLYGVEAAAIATGINLPVRLA